MKTNRFLVLVLLLSFITSSAQIITPFDAIKLKYNSKKNSATRVMVQDSITGVCGWILKSSLTSSGGTSLPSQTGNSGKFLTTNGTAPSWATIPTPNLQAVTGVAEGVQITHPIYSSQEIASFNASTNKGAGLSENGLIVASNTSNAVTINADLISASRTQQLPNKDGTFAMMSDVADATTLQAIIENGSTTSNQMIVGSDYANGLTLNSSYCNISETTSSYENQVGFSSEAFYSSHSDILTGNYYGAYLSPIGGVYLGTSGNGFGTQIKSDLVTANRVLQVPDHNGILLTDADISGKADLTGASFIGDVTGNVTPAGSTSFITKNYLDNAITGISWKQAVKCATTANISLSGTSNIDGVTIPAGTRILVKNQTTTTENGIYVSAAGAWSRATDADTGAELETSTVAVTAGTINKNTQWTCTSTSITVGTTPIAYGQISGAGTYTNGTGIDLTANVFSLSSAVQSQLNNAVPYTGATSNLNMGTYAVTAQQLISSSGCLLQGGPDGVGTYNNSNNSIAVYDGSTDTYNFAHNKLTYNDTTDVFQWNGSDVAKVSDITTALGTYVTSSSLTSTLSSYATSADLNIKVDINSAITGATKTKITYDSKGLVTGGSDATTADIADSTNKRYVTDAYSTLLSNCTKSGQTTYSQTPAWTGTTPPSGAQNFTYNWTKNDNKVTLTVTLVYATAGAALTAVTIPFPTGAPAPVTPTGLSSASEILYMGTGRLSVSKTNTTATTSFAAIRNNSGNTAKEIIIQQASGAYTMAQITIDYFTS